jgi:hypothetical protein
MTIPVISKVRPIAHRMLAGETKATINKTGPNTNHHLDSLIPSYPLRARFMQRAGSH